MLTLPARYLLPAALLITGCTKPWSPTYEYACADGYEFSITFSDTDHPGDIAVLKDADGQTKLPRAPSASGIRYSNEATEFFAKGDEAIIRKAGAIVHQDCAAG